MMSAVTPTSPGFPLGVGSTTLAGFAGGPSSVSGSPRGISRPTTPLSAGIQPLGPTYDDVRKWEDADIASWLQSARLGTHAATFVENDIRGSVLLDVDQAALKEMGITSVGDRVRIFAAIKALNKRCAESAALERRRRGSNSSLSTSPRRIHISLPRTDPYLNGSNESQDGEMEYLEFDNSDLDRADEAGELGGNGMSKGSLGGRARQIRPPPLLLKQSASRGLPGHNSPVATINSSQGFGLSAARGLTPGAGRGSIGSRTMGVPSKPGDGLNSSSGSLHRKVNSIGSSPGQAMGAALPLAGQDHHDRRTAGLQRQPHRVGAGTRLGTP
ncbi:ATP binding [Thecaphora frezii]